MTGPTSCAHQANACRRCRDEWAAAERLYLRAVLVRVQQDINWMMNEGKLLNPETFAYLHDALDSGDEE